MSPLLLSVSRSVHHLVLCSSLSLPLSLLFSLFLPRLELIAVCDDRARFPGVAGGAPPELARPTELFAAAAIDCCFFHKRFIQ